MDKPRIKCYSQLGSWWFKWEGRGIWRVDKGDNFKTWRDVQVYAQVPFVGY